MALNIVKIKSYASYFIVAFIPLFIFISILISTFNLLLSTIISVIFIMPLVIFGRKLSETPLRKVDEGEGLMILDLNSRGIVKAYIGRIEPPYVITKTESKTISTFYDRDASFSFELPKEIKSVSKINVNDKEYLLIEMPEKKHYFQFERFYPTFIINSNAGFIYDKERIGKLEESYLTKTDLNYLKLKVEELTGILRDFARYVVEQLKPKVSLFQNWIVWIILMVVIGGLILMVFNFLPNIFPTQTAVGGGGAGGGQIVVGR